MLEILTSVIGPVVIVVAVGAIVGHRIGLETTTLSKIAFWILGPAFMFDGLATADLAGDAVLGLAGAAITSFVAAGFVGAALSKMLGSTVENLSADVVSSTYGNVGNAGIAICVFALGDGVRPSAIVVMVVINTIGVVLGVALATARTQSVWVAVRTGITTPLTLGALLAVPVNYFDLALPDWFDRPVGLIADALIPVMLLTLGLQLRKVDLARPEPGVFASAPAKLIVAPVAAYFAAQALGLDDVNAGVVLMQASMPPAVFTMLVALEHDLAPRRVTSALVTLTGLSLLTVPLAVFVAR
ncbi:MAG: AEC family transporter [Acidimicrobiales bacterium]